MNARHTDHFGRFASSVAHLAGKPSTFAFAVMVVAVWALLGPAAGFSDFWQLAINTGTTIVTFLMVFIIQNTQNRDTAALHAKIDELIRATESAQNSLLNLEDLSEEEIEQVRAGYREMAGKAAVIKISRRRGKVPGKILGKT